MYICTYIHAYLKLINVHIVTESEDYESGPFNIIILAGEISTSFNISIIDNNVFEINESFNVTIDQSTLSDRVLLNTVGCIVSATILDDDSKF